MTFTENGGRPGDARGFLHKKLFKAAVGIGKRAFAATPVGGIVTTGLGIGRSVLGRSRGTVPRTLTARVTQFSAAEKEQGRQLKFGGPTTLSQPSAFGGIPRGASGGGTFLPVGQETEDQRCSRLRRGDFQDQAEWQRTCGVAAGVGAAVMGRYGAALQPGSMMIDRAVCLRGMQLGDDGLCYNKSQITNKQRMWPAGRKPLLSGGDMRAIGIAARAGRRLEGATKRLQRLGMMKKPARRLGPGRAHAHAKPIAAVSV